MGNNEATSRIKINKLLEDAGWLLLDSQGKEANVLLENKAKLTKTTIDGFGDNFENSKNGFIDFLLVAKDGRALSVLEAKSEEKNPLCGKEQARGYAESINCRFVILSNGLSHYFWDLKQGNPEEITTFPTQEALEAYFSFNPDIDTLINEQVDENFIAETQYANFRNNPDFINEATRAVFLRENKIKQLRHYQVNAVKAIQKAVASGKKKFLFEMATGTGKTLTSAAIIKLFLKTENAKKVLFIVDRLELENQADEDLKSHLRNSGYNISIFKENKDNWRRSDIVISTVQSFNNGKYRQEFKPDDFDLIISDEAHRSITGNYRAVFEYFVGYKLGLTATPKNYLKNFKNTNLNDEREIETRTLLDTYKTFGCEGGEPTFRYGLLDGVKDNVLINPRVLEIETEVTTQLLSDEGYAAIIENNTEDDAAGDEKHEEKFGKRDFEVRFFSPNTNYQFCKIFLQKALKDPITGEIGKTIIFCVRQSHAAKITQILNEMAHEIWPNKYNSDFAVQITSDVQAAQEKTTKFKNNQLSGNANFNPEYKTSKTRVCVTVGMMTTGYDCEDLLNICLMRPVFSPSEFVQIKGRGTRRHNFSSNLANERLKEENSDKNKQVFLLFDYFATCKYFEEEFDYEEVIKLPPQALSQPLFINSSRQGQASSPIVEPFTNLSVDEVKSIREIFIGNEGMRVDRMFLNFEDKIVNDSFIAEKVKEGDFSAVEAYIEQQYIDKPTEYFTVEGLNKSLKHYAPNLGRKVSLTEFVKKAFGIIPEYKSKYAISDEAYFDFSKAFTPQDGIKPENLEYFYKALLENKSIRDKIEQRDLSFLHGGYAESSILNIEQFKAIPADVREKVVQHIKSHSEFTQILNQSA